MHSKYPELLREAAKASEEDLAFEKYDVGKKNLTVKLFIVLKPLVDSGSGRAVVSGTTMQNGFYLWHKLVRDIRPDDKLKEVKWRKALQNPEFPKDEAKFQECLQKWEASITAYEAECKKSFSREDMYASLLDGAPANMSQNITLNLAALSTYESPREFIVSVLRAKRK